MKFVIMNDIFTSNIKAQNALNTLESSPRAPNRHA